MFVQSVIAYSLSIWGETLNFQVKTIFTMQKNGIKSIFNKIGLYHNTDEFNDFKVLKQLRNIETIILLWIKKGFF